MSVRAVAIRLKIPDNEAYTALTALRRLTVDIGRLERADIWLLNDDAAKDDFVERVERNEMLFNPNKHELELLSADRPRSGEVWIAEIDAADEPLRIEGVAWGRRYTGWRLFSHGHEPSSESIVREAAEKLLCNPAIEKAIYS